MSSLKDFFIEYLEIFLFDAIINNKRKYYEVFRVKGTF